MNRLLAIVCLSLLLGACAWLPGQRPACDCPPQPTGHDGQRLMLNQGYSMLYSDAGQISRIDRLFLVKVESEDVQRVVERSTRHAREFVAKLERVARDFPAVDIHLQPEPELVYRAVDAARRNAFKRFAPVFGETGATFERTLLIKLASILDRERFIVQVTAEAESDTALKQILENTEDRYRSDYNAVMKLLNEQYFKDNTYQPDQ